VSVASMHARKFYQEVAQKRVLWTIKDNVGYPAPMTSEGVRAMPFWSSRSRAEKIISNVAVYKPFESEEVSWEEFLSYWVPDLANEGMLIGVNWSGKRATGYDVAPLDVKTNVEWEMKNLKT